MTQSGWYSTNIKREDLDLVENMATFHYYSTRHLFIKLQLPQVWRLKVQTVERDLIPELLHFCTVEVVKIDGKCLKFVFSQGKIIHKHVDVIQAIYWCLY